MTTRTPHHFAPLLLCATAGFAACGSDAQPPPRAAASATGASPSTAADDRAPAQREVEAEEVRAPGAKPVSTEPPAAAKEDRPAAPASLAPPPAAVPPPAAAAQGAAPAPAGATPRTEPSRAQADALSVAELVQRKDLWPARVAFVKETRLDEMTWWRPGEELPLHGFDGQSVILDEGTFLFDCPAEHTDVVARTRTEAAALSPEALALNVRELRQRPELWPVRLQIASRLEFGGNTVVPPGREVALRFFEGDMLAVYDREVANYYTVEAHETDVMARARARLELPEAEREPFFLRSLGAALDAPDPAVAKRLAEADYVVVYAARLGCGRCAQFLPELKDAYARLRADPQAAKFEVVVLPEDANAQAAKQYRAESQPPGGVLAFERRLEAADLMAIPLQLLPGLMVFDRKGKLVERNEPNGGAPSASDVLASFETRLKQPVAR